MPSHSPALGSAPSPPSTTLGYALFATRWLQAPLYFGLVAAQGVYVYKFFNELWNLILRCVTGQATETYVMLAVLKLVDVVMIANLLIMVIVGGYETFVSRIGLQGHRDQPEWLSHVNSNVLKVKLATAIVGISSVHLLQMFVDVHHTARHALLWGTVIHMAFIASAAILAYMSGPMVGRTDHGHRERRELPDDGVHGVHRDEGAGDDGEHEVHGGGGVHGAGGAHGTYGGREVRPSGGAAASGRVSPAVLARIGLPTQSAASREYADDPGRRGREDDPGSRRYEDDPGSRGYDDDPGRRGYEDEPGSHRIGSEAAGPAYETHVLRSRPADGHGAHAGNRAPARDLPETGAEARMRAARFPFRKLLEEFDEDHPRSFDREALARLGKLEFVGARRNVVFVGGPGTGKTHLAIGLGVRACQAGHRVLFATAGEWADRLAAARAEGRLGEELAALDDYPVLIVDEVGYLSFDADTARLFFRLVAHRYERGSLIVTSDRPLGRWDDVFGGSAAAAMVDRLVHHAEIVRLEGDSYRTRRATSAWAE
ncbi:IS21-like element helper ATPase IstB [Streptomyces cavernae]|uniref:IS21-like element helper ATPase IstB n=1 Tax=Streptomyces cavernae TaxID=2259034 RepID=UPI001EE4D54B|nr:IS21-like element helper ATPase IstB [Streptomyces cavernae]